MSGLYLFDASITPDGCLPPELKERGGHLRDAQRRPRQVLEVGHSPRFLRLEWNGNPTAQVY